MNFAPKSEEEVAAGELLPAGEYDFDVLASEDKISKSGNEMIEIKIGVYSKETGQIAKHVFDYLLESMAFKLRHFCGTTGLMPEYESGEINAEMCLARSGIAKIGIEKGKDAYPDKNKVIDYIPRETEKEPF